MIATVSPSKISGSVTAAASKSAMQRACAAALIKKGKTTLYNPGVSNDDKAALAIIQKLGASVSYEGEKIIISSDGVKPVADEINCGESGLSFRMFTSIAALSEQPIKITGSGSLQNRPQSFFTEILPQLAVKCESNDGLLPLRVQGPLIPKNITIDGALSSQFLTGLLFAYAARDARDVTITVANLSSKPYIDLTLQTFVKFCIPCPSNNNYESFHFAKEEPPVNVTGPTDYWVEGDWSGAAFLLVAGAIAGHITVKGLQNNSTQADKTIIDALIKAGATIKISKEQIEVYKSDLESFNFDATECPDLFPPLVALASYCDGISVIKGIHRLTHKESNRALTLQEEFGKMGVAVFFEQDNMMVVGNGALTTASVHSHHDHRIAMACAVAALGANGAVTIEGADAINKSYPQFWSHLQQLGATVSLTNNP